MAEDEVQSRVPADTHAYGTLATRLSESLRRVREAVEPHQELLPSRGLSGLNALLAEFERRRVRIALYGEVKAGKSTLLNALAGAALSPVAFDPITSLPVRVTYGEQTTWHLGERSLGSVEELSSAMREQAADSVEVVVETNLDLLHLGGQVDLLDTPGVGSEDQFDAVTADVLHSLDAVVLVVRYPALFTQFTRHLMRGLQTDIGKLFVVWNLDSACAELTPEERRQHTENLRAAVAGAHELFAVEARAGFEAARGRNEEAVVASGLRAFTDAVARFASSGARDVAALREAAKRARRWLKRGEHALSERRGALGEALAQARERLRKVQADADAQKAAVRAQHADFDAAVAQVAETAHAKVVEAEAELRRSIRSARRGWMYRGDPQSLEQELSAASAELADGVSAANQAVVQGLHAAAERFEARFDMRPRARMIPHPGEIAPAERCDRAATGRWQMVRRGLWRRWYLPGLARFEKEDIAAEREAQAAWLDGACAAARKAADETMTAKLGEITRRADGDVEAIRAETHFAANEAEFQSLSEHLPVLTEQLAAIDGVAAEARQLI